MTSSETPLGALRWIAARKGARTTVDELQEAARAALALYAERHPTAGIPDPWVELTPGALGRLTLHSAAVEVAEDLRTWAAPESLDRMVAWFLHVAEHLDEVDG